MWGYVVGAWIAFLIEVGLGLYPTFAFGYAFGITYVVVCEYFMKRI